jgi:hypothetical protein
MYSSSGEEEALLILALEDEENSRFVFLSDRCRSFFFRDMQKLFFSEERKVIGSTKSMYSLRSLENFIH